MGRMAGKESARGATSDAVRANIKEVREAQNLNYTQVSEQLATLGWSISAVGVRRIESGERRVDVDDLTAIAVALGVSPASLLMPNLKTVTKNDLVPITGWHKEISAIVVWRWLTARDDLVYGTILNFLNHGLPSWERAERIASMRRIPSGLVESPADGND